MLRATSIAFDAEVLRLQLLLRRMAIRAVLGAVALTFLVSALVLAHVAVWFWLRVRCDWPLDGAAAALTAGDLILASVAAAIVLRLGPGRLEIEARLVRKQACAALAETAVWPSIVMRLLGLLRRS